MHAVWISVSTRCQVRRSREEGEGYQVKYQVRVVHCYHPMLVATKIFETRDEAEEFAFKVMERQIPVSVHRIPEATDDQK